jgi:hypothetical protein
MDVEDRQWLLPLLHSMQHAGHFSTEMVLMSRNISLEITTWERCSGMTY